MRICAILFCLLSLCGTVQGYIADQNLFFLAGKDAALAEGDMYHRAVYYIVVPQSFTDTVYIRIFDADLAGAHDRWQPDSEVRYRVYGEGAIEWRVQAIDEPLSTQSPLAELVVGENNAYNDQWRTIAELNPAEGEGREDSRYFQLIVDGVKGRAVNKYQVFVSAQDKENTPIGGIRMMSPIVMLYLPSSPGMATQLEFTIPPHAHSLEIFNFDADLVDKGATFHFEMPFTQAIPIESSRNEEMTSTTIEVSAEDRGKPGAVVLRNPKEANHIQFWITDNGGNTVPLFLPTFTGPDNHLPLADFTAVPLSECLSVLLDASISSDEDYDELSFEWIFPDGTRTPGSRIVHQFQEADTYNVTLVVSDNSGFVANSTRLTRTIHINHPPTAVITAPEKVAVNKAFTLDASESQDLDGTILKYIWNLGDGMKGEGENLIHTYDRPGNYQVTLIVEDDSQSLCSQARTTQWIWVNASPVPRLNVKSIGAIDEAIPLNADGSIDSDGEIQIYAWDFGDGHSAEGREVTHAWTEAGTYTVRLKVTDNAGLSNSSATAQQTIVINDPPMPRAAYREVIAAQEDVTFDGTVSVDPDGSIRKYVWKMGDGAEKEGGIIQHAYEAPGTYAVTLTVTDNTDTLNNTASTTFQVRVNSPPQPEAGDDQLVNNSEVFFNAGISEDQDDPITSYVWDFGDGSQKQGKAVSHVYALPGTYTVTLTVTDASGTRSATQSDTMEVIVNHPPIADAGGSQIVAPGETVVLDGTFSEDPNGKIEVYQWNLTENIILEGDIVEYVYDQPGHYQARLTVVDKTGAESVDYAVITVNARPKAEFYPVPRVAPGQIVTFDGSPSSDADGQIRQVFWDFGDGSPVQEGLAVQHQFTDPGRYVVTLTVHDDSAVANNTASYTQTVEVNYPPQAEAGPDIHTCSQKVAFDASKSTDPDGDALVYLWDFGDGTRGQGRGVEHTYLNPGIYPVSLTVTDGYDLNNSVSQASLTAYVNAPPIAEININSSTVCAGELVLFDAGQSTDLEQGLLRYRWDLGDGELIEGINPVREYTEGGNYRIRLQVTDDSELACNSSETETMLHVIDAPIADAGANQTACANIPVQFDASASTRGGRRIKSYEWEFGDGQSGVGVSPAHVYADVGEYTARLLITVAGEGECSNVSEDEVTMRVMAAPVAKFQVQKAACANEILEFDASASHSSEGQITAFDWEFGDGASASGKTISHAYEMPGTYQATLRITTDSQGQCRTSEYVEMVTVNAVPTPVIQVSAAGQEPVMGKSYNTAPQTILHFSGAESVDSDGYVAGYTWDFGDGQTAEGAFVTHQYTTPGTYAVTLHIQDNSGTMCNTTASTMHIQVREPENQPVNGPEMVCVGQPFVYTIDTETQPVEWRLNDGTTAIGSQFEHTFKVPGTYQLQAKIGVDWMPAKEITVFRLPDMHLPAHLHVYPGDPVNIQPVYDTSTDLPLQFQWEMGDGTRFAAERVNHQYAVSGNMAAELVVSMQGGPECLQSTYSLPVVVHTPPEVTIQARPEQIFTGGAHDAVTFKAVLSGEPALWNYAWDFGDGDTAIGQRVMHPYRQSGTFEVTVTLSDPLLRTAQTYVFSTEIEVSSRK